MKLEIRKRKAKTRNKTVTFQVRNEHPLIFNVIKDCLTSHPELFGTLPLAEHLADKIQGGIKARRNLSDNSYVDFPVSIPVDLAKRMQESDRELARRGHVPDWDSEIRKYLDMLIRGYTSQLEKILGEDIPSELKEYRKNKKTKKCFRPFSPTNILEMRNESS